MTQMEIQQNIKISSLGCRLNKTLIYSYIFLCSLHFSITPFRNKKNKNHIFSSLTDLSC